MKKRGLAWCLAAILLLSVFSFGVQADAAELVILYENDVHCAIEGYAKLSAMKKELAQTVPYVGLVSSGDFVQGSSLGAVSQGEYIVNTMNLVGYDAFTVGNHEFDYKLPRLQELTALMNTKPVCCNFGKIGEEASLFQPYTIVSYGETDIAYIGVTTPDTITSSSPIQFMDEQGNYIYTFHGSDLYQTVQNTIDAAVAKGADYVIALTHLGTESVYEQWSAQALIANTAGLDVVLDGHSHSVVEALTVADKNGDGVLLSSTGTKFQYIGQLTLSGGKFTTRLVATEAYEAEDPAVMDYIAAINEEYGKLGNRKIGESKVDLTTVDENGQRIIRNRETNLGDLCADAYRVVMGADIGLQNGGGIRADIAAGDVTFNDLLSVFPFNNTVCVVEATGQQIVDMLELGVVNYPNEDGTFQQVSGITFAINGEIPSPVVLDENLMFVEVQGERRVSDVKVLDKRTRTYLPIDLEKTYTVASHSYLLLEQGGGATMFKNAKVVKNDGVLDVEVLEQYIVAHLGGVIGEEYAHAKGRIVTQKAQFPSVEESEPKGENPKTGESAVIFVSGGLLLLSAAWLVVSGRKEQ